LRGTSPSGALFFIHIQNRDEEYKEANYNQKPIKVEEYESDQYIFCSKKQPAVISSSQGKWTAEFLKPGRDDAIFGANEWAYSLYYASCHNTIRSVDESLARRLGYNFNDGELDIVEFNNPDAILSWNKDYGLEISNRTASDRSIDAEKLKDRDTSFKTAQAQNKIPTMGDLRPRPPIGSPKTSSSELTKLYEEKNALRIRVQEKLEPATDLISKSNTSLSALLRLTINNSDYTIDKEDSCKFGKNLIYDRDRIVKKWDGSWLPNTEIGIQEHYNLQLISADKTESGSDVKAGKFWITLSTIWTNSGIGFADGKDLNWFLFNNLIQFYKDSEQGELHYSIEQKPRFNGNSLGVTFNFPISKREEVINLTKKVLSECAKF